MKPYDHEAYKGRACVIHTMFDFKLLLFGFGRYRDYGQGVCVSWTSWRWYRDLVSVEIGPGHWSWADVDHSPDFNLSNPANSRYQSFCHGMFIDLSIKYYKLFDLDRFVWHILKLIYQLSLCKYRCDRN